MSSELVSVIVSEALSIYTVVTSALASTPTASSTSRTSTLSTASTRSTSSSLSSAVSSVTSVATSSNELPSASESLTTPTSAASNLDNGSGGGTKNNDRTLAIALGVSLGVLTLITLLLVLLLCHRRRRHRRQLDALASRGRSQSRSPSPLKRDGTDLWTSKNSSTSASTQSNILGRPSPVRDSGIPPVMSQQPVNPQHALHSNPFAPVPPPSRGVARSHPSNVVDPYDTSRQHPGSVAQPGQPRVEDQHPLAYDNHHTATGINGDNISSESSYSSDRNHDYDQVLRGHEKEVALRPQSLPRNQGTADVGGPNTKGSYSNPFRQQASRSSGSYHNARYSSADSGVAELSGDVPRPISPSKMPNRDNGARDGLMSPVSPISPAFTSQSAGFSKFPHHPTGPNPPNTSRPVSDRGTSNKHSGLLPAMEGVFGTPLGRENRNGAFEQGPLLDHGTQSRRNSEHYRTKSMHPDSQSIDMPPRRPADARIGRSSRDSGRHVGDDYFRQQSTERRGLMTDDIGTAY